MVALLRSRVRVLAVTLGVLLPAAVAVPAEAEASVLPISSDPFTQATCAASATTNHHTEVEPDTFAAGSTIVSAFQVGRIYAGGACAIGFATSTNNGASWTAGLLPGITKYSGSGPNDRATDAPVAYDAAHNVWLISSLTLLESGGVHGNSVVTSRSSNGGLTWSSPPRRRPGVISTRTGSCVIRRLRVRSTGTATPSGITTEPGICSR